MREGGQIVRCPYCGRLYRFYSMMVGDQNGCPSCVRKRHDEADKVMGDMFRSNWGRVNQKYLVKNTANPN